MKETKYVAFSTQKGGAGKTTLTVLVASYLHYVKGYDVAVIDCDFPQYSIHDMRKRDMDRISKDDYYKVQAFELIKTLQKKPYIIECNRAEDAIGKAEALQASLPLDFIFFDLPGTVNNAEVVSTLFADGLYLHAHHRRPRGDGKLHQVRHCHQRADGRHGQIGHQGDLPDMEHGRRARKDGALRHL